MTSQCGIKLCGVPRAQRAEKSVEILSQECCNAMHTDYGGHP